MPLDFMEAVQKLEKAESDDGRQSVPSAFDLVLDSLFVLQKRLPDGYADIVREYCVGAGLIEASLIRGSLPYIARLKFAIAAQRLAILACLASIGIAMFMQVPLAWVGVPLSVVIWIIANGAQSYANLWLASFCWAKRRLEESDAC